MIERLSRDDAASNVELSRSVGWQDSESEWRVLHDAALVLGIKQQGRLLAQGALGDYGSAATLAKMVVAPEHQRQGLGAKLLERLLSEADSSGLPVGLCASEQGRPLYGSRGFEVTGELVILTGTPLLGTEAGPADVSVLDVDAAVVLDRRFTGVDRSRMLRARRREASAAFGSVPGAVPAFGMASQQGQGSLVGPIMADTEAAARQVACALFRAAPGPVRVDVPLQHGAFRGWLVGLGLREQGQRVEMARGTARLPWQVGERFALATQAWG